MLYIVLAVVGAVIFLLICSVSRVICLVLFFAALAALLIALIIKATREYSDYTELTIVGAIVIMVLSAIGFFSFHGFSDVKIKDGVLLEYKGDEAVYTVPEEVTSIGYGAFTNSQTQEVVLHVRVNDIAPGAFKGRGNVTVTMSSAHPSFYMENGNLLKREGHVLLLAAFDGTVSAEAESIADYAYSNMPEGSAITLPAVESVGANAFVGCAAAEIHLSDMHYFSGALFEEAQISRYYLNGVTEIGSDVFGGMEADHVELENCSFAADAKPFDGAEIKKLVLKNTEPQSGLLKGLKAEALTIPYTVGGQFQDLCGGDPAKTLKWVKVCGGEIPEAYFKNCRKLKTVVLGEDVVGSIGKEAFLGCNSIETIYVGKGVTGFGEKAVDLNSGWYYTAEVHYTGTEAEWAERIGFDPDDKSWRRATTISVVYNTTMPE